MPITVVAFTMSVPFPASVLTREGPDLFALRVAALRRAIRRDEWLRAGLDPDLFPEDENA